VGVVVCTAPHLMMMKVAPDAQAAAFIE
jgi:hypothetical protein